MTRAALIIGASSGIGRATALRLARDGGRLVLMSRSREALESVAGECRDAGATRVDVCAGDTLREADVQRAVDAAVQAFGELDAVVHTATVMAYGQLETLPPDVFRTVVDTAVTGTLHTARAALPVFRRQHRGTLVFVNSLLGSVTVPNMGAYATAKWAQKAMIRTLQQETRDEPDVHVCTLSPGSTNTPIYYQAANYLGRNARPPVPVLQPDGAAEQIVRMLHRPRGNVSIPVGPLNPVIIAGFRLLPAVYDMLVGPLFRLGALAGGEQQATEGNVRSPNPQLERVHGRWPDR
jgi:NAD(P)-dependent dehydrogenase (short-subunit alcohol dehydrogenase family)